MHENKALKGDVRILRDEAGTNPGGIRYAYQVSPEGLAQYNVVRTSYVALAGVSVGPNLHPQEESGQFMLSTAAVSKDFIKI